MPDIVSPTYRPAAPNSPTSSRASDALSSPPDSPVPPEISSEDEDSQNAHFRRVDHYATPRNNGRLHSDANGDCGTSDDSDGSEDVQPPYKKRKTKIGTPPSSRKPKIVSPPWKKVEAEGPTSYTENGRRKSGRINTLPEDRQSSTRKRSARHSLNGPPSGLPKERNRPLFSNGSKSTKKGEKIEPARRVMSNPGNPVKKQAPSSRSRRSSTSQPLETRQSTRPRRATRLADHAESKSQAESSLPNRRSWDHELEQSSRPRLRIGRSGVIPLVHPDQVRKRPKIGTSFSNYWERGAHIPVEEGGLLASEDGPPYTDEMAQKDAQTILRIEREAEPGGLLSQDRCSLFVPESGEEPPRQWARQDHMARAMAGFRRLLLAEQQRHRATAKRLAEACRDHWLRRQPKSAEEIEIEERERWVMRFRIVIRAMLGTWENVRLRVNQQRLEQWEAEEQKRVKAALNEAVSLSEQKLQARCGGLDSELASDEDSFGDLSGNSSEVSDHDDDVRSLSADSDSGEASEDSDNMSSSEDEDDDDSDENDGNHEKYHSSGGGASDENLTQEQLRDKYANLHIQTQDANRARKSDALNPDNDSDKLGTDSAEDVSDESVDMDDDLGSDAIEDRSAVEDGSDVPDADSEGSAPDGLLRLFFGKSELARMNAQAMEQADQPPMGDLVLNSEGHEMASNSPGHGETDNDDDGKMSLVRHPDSVAGDLPEAERVFAHKTGRHGNLAASSSDVLRDGRSNLEQTKSVKELSAENNTTQDTIRTNGKYDSSAASLEHMLSANTKLADNTTSLPSPETTPALPPTSLGVSKASSTSETRPSSVGVLSTVDRSVAKGETSRSPSVNLQVQHKTEIPFLLRGTLREYQHDGLDWLAGLYANSTNGILADEMGLGKTIQTIALLAHLACQHEVWGPHLVVVPTSVMLNWEMEFKKWCPGFKILAYYGSQEERKRKRQGWNNNDVWNVCITSYQLVLQDQQVFKRRRWHYLILDEAHNIKNFKSQRWQTLLGFNTHSRLLLTGTPLQNNLTELWSLLFFLMPAGNGVGGFADLQEFHDWFHKPESQILESGRDQMDDEARAIISKLHKVLRPYLLRRLKADVERQMPAKYEHVEFCRLSKRQRELYDGFLSRSDIKETLASGNYLSIINCLMQLRKVCNHPDLFIDRPITTSFCMKKPVAADLELMERTVRRMLHPVDSMGLVSLDFLNLVPTQHEGMSSVHTERIFKLSSPRALTDLREAQQARANAADVSRDISTVQSGLAYLESVSRWDRSLELQHCIYLNAFRRQRRPIFGQNVVELVTIDVHRRPRRRRPRVPQKIMAWFENESTLLRSMILTLDDRAESLKTKIQKFSCVTPAVVTRDLERFLLGRQGVAAFTEEDLKLSAPVRWAPFLPKEAPMDPWHEARMRLSIHFPDKRLLQYDCGKLQVLDQLLRKLQAGGHRVLIFTQMTKVLDILERFLNIHGHKYLRLDGATKVEQRQIMTDRFNNDPRILCFILSTRSGGLGINLTGADTVIFYDQDWNPAMDKQCQDRCHRIGQTRDVHIYRLVSEHTIEANILRKASQKQMLDDVVIQEGEFTTEYFDRPSVRDVLANEAEFSKDGVSAADAALDRVLGGPDGGSNKEGRNVGRVLEQAEDREDVAAARVAEREIQADEADFTERPSAPPSGASTTRQGTPVVNAILEGTIAEGDATPAEVEEESEFNAWGVRINNIDQYMLGVMTEQLKGTKLELPKDKKKGKKKGKDTRKR